MQQTTKRRVAYLDVLKAFAIIAVVLYHSGFLIYGYLGVDLFLVIGGYLITFSLMKRVFGESQGGYINFELSRVARLLPLLLVAGLFCMVLGFFTMLPDDYENLSETVIATNCFANNILGAITSNNYWDVKNDFKPLMHTWYVGLVMQFYLVYPILFYLAKLDKKNPRGTLLTLVASLTFISLLLYFGTGILPAKISKFYHLPARFFEFGVGGIVALVQNPSEKKPFHMPFVFCCYALLLVLLALNKELVPKNIRLVLVVGLSCVLIMSGDTLSNKLTGNTMLAKVGAASYSIFVWHQVLLAFYRYTVTCNFTFGTYALFLFATGLLSWLSYHFIEQPTASVLKDKKRSKIFWAFIVFAFLELTSFAAYIYMVAGVVRDIPELYVSKTNRHRNMHAEYVDRGYEYDKPFVTEKQHWLVIGNSLGRDIVNIIVESDIIDSVEVSYICSTDYKKDKYSERFATADRIFISSLPLTESFVSDIEKICIVNGFPLNRLVIVGDRDFGASNGQVYAKRYRADYFDQYIPLKGGEQFIIRNRQLRELYGGRFLDMMAMVSNEKGEVRVFSPDHHFISADNVHLSRGGAIYFGQIIDWSKYY